MTENHIELIGEKGKIFLFTLHFRPPDYFRHSVQNAPKAENIQTNWTD